ASVNTLGVSACAPLDAWNVTATPATGLPDESFSATRSEIGATAPGNAVWLSPCTLAMGIRLLPNPRTVSVPSAVVAPLVSTAWIDKVADAAASGKNMSQLNAPFAVVTLKSGCPVTETRSVVLLLNPTIARRALLPAVTVPGDTIIPGDFAAGCAVA